MNEIDRLFEKYAKSADIGYDECVKILVKSDFRQAITEALEKQMLASLDAFHIYIKGKIDSELIHGIHAAIFESNILTKLEEQGNEIHGQ